MRDVSREWKSAMMQRGVDSRRLVSIWINDEQVDFVTGASPLFGVPNSALSVSAHSASIDIWSRAISIGERLVKLKRDRLVRDLISGSYLEGRRLEVRLGCAALDRSQWELEWVGQIKDHPSKGDNSVEIRAQDVAAF